MNTWKIAASCSAGLGLLILAAAGCGSPRDADPGSSAPAEGIGQRVEPPFQDIESGTRAPALTARRTHHPLESDIGKAGPAVPVWATRTGARRASGYRHPAAFIDYEPQEGLELAALKRAGEGKEPAFAVEPFAERTDEEVASGFHVEQAGVIAALAIAKQLDHMGFAVGFFPAKASDSTEKLEIDLERYGKHVLVDGAVAFVIEHGRRGATYLTTARIDLTAGFTAGEPSGGVPVQTVGGRSQLAGPAPKRLFTSRVTRKETVEGKNLAEASERSRRAASVVLSRAVNELFADDALDAALARHIVGDAQ